MNIWMNDVRDPTNFATWLLERCITSHQKKKKKKKNLWPNDGFWKPLTAPRTIFPHFQNMAFWFL